MPAIIMTSEYTLPTIKASFADYATHYMMRASALIQKPDRTALDNIELEHIMSAMFSNAGQEHVSMLEQTEQEAESTVIMSDEAQAFEKYLSYMTRAKALIQKQELSQDEQLKLGRVMNGMSKVDQEKTKLGTFTERDHNLNKQQVRDLSRKFADAQRRGSVMYQDIVSFDKGFLESQGLYDPKTDSLNEAPLVDAGRAMMNLLATSEKMENMTWTASFHRNTAHIHIHFSAVEAFNTRSLVVDENGSVSPKGKRSQATIDSMKMTFANTLLDRTEERQRIGEMRNDLIATVKQVLPGDEKSIQKIIRFREQLPDDKRRWSYAYLHGEQKEAMDDIVSDLMSDNSEYRAYQDAVQQSQDLDIEMYGKSSRSTKNYAQNQMADINKRLGNQVINYLKQADKSGLMDDISLDADGNVELSDDYLKQLAKVSQESIRRTNQREQDFQQEALRGRSNIRAEPRQKQTQTRMRRSFSLAMGLKRDLNKIKRSMSDYVDPDKFRDLQAYERTQQKIQMEQNH